MSNTTLYSVVVPTYNRSSDLVRLLGTLVNQSIDTTTYEIVVVDDGSSDDTAARVKEFAANHTNHQIRYVHKLNGGSGSARNAGVAVAVGEIIFLPMMIVR